jgi:hypothetical protein
MRQLVQELVRVEVSPGRPGKPDKPRLAAAH